MKRFKCLYCEKNCIPLWTKMRATKWSHQTCKNCGNKVLLNQNINLPFIFFEVTIQFSLMVWSLVNFSLPLFIFYVLMIFILEFLRGLLVPLVKSDKEEEIL